MYQITSIYTSVRYTYSSASASNAQSNAHKMYSYTLLRLCSGMLDPWMWAMQNSRASVMKPACGPAHLHLCSHRA